MSRAVVGVDRAVVAVLGVLLLLAGGALALWALGRWPAGWWPGTTEEVDASGLTALPEHPWWPWALGVVAVVAVALALRSLVAHAVRPRVGSLRLQPAPLPGRLRADLGAVAGAASRALQAQPGVDECGARLRLERHVPVVELHARVDASTPVSAVRAAVDRTREELSAVVPEGAVALRVTVTVDRNRYDNPRVR